MARTSTLNYLKSELYALLKEDDSIFEFLQAGSMDGIWYWDLENPENEWMSEAFWLTLGYDPAEKKHLASEWQDIIFSEDLEKAIDNFRKHVADPTHPYDQVVRYRHRDSSTVWIRCRGLAIRDEDGKAVRMLGAHTDITELKHAEEALVHRTRELEKANEQLDEFVRIASHDLKSPLNAIERLLGWVADESEGVLTDELMENLGLAKQRAVRMRRLLDDLLSYSRLGRDRESREVVELSTVVSDICELLDLNEKKFVISSSSAKLFVEPVALKTVLLNLISNAVKHSVNREGSVHVSASELPMCYEISVEDDGPGIPEQFQERIFQVFQTLKPRDEVEGSGVGLAVVKKIVDSIGGDITLVSKEGEGAKFVVRWPASA